MTVPWNIRLDLGRIMSWVHSRVVLNWVWCAGKNADSRWNGFKLSQIPPNCSHLNQHSKKKKEQSTVLSSYDCSLEEDQQYQWCIHPCHKWQNSKTIQLMQFKWSSLNQIRRIVINNIRQTFRSANLLLLLSSSKNKPPTAHRFQSPCRTAEFHDLCAPRTQKTQAYDLKLT